MIDWPDGERQLLALIDSLPQGILVLVDDRVRVANPAARSQLGIGNSALSSLAPRAFFGDEACARAALSIEPFDGEAELQRLDGSLYPARVCARSLLVGGMQARLLMLEDLSAARRLASRLATQHEEMHMLTRRLMTLQEDERAALSRELHDDIGQAITAIKLCASSLLHGPGPVRHSVVVETAQEIAQVADQTVAKLRDLSLLLRPPQLDALGLEAALRWQANTLFRGDGPRLRLEIESLDCRPPREVELACFRIAQEALTNVLRHAQAGRVTLRLWCEEDLLHVSVTDDGRGLRPDRRPGLGFVTMRERAEQLGGRLGIVEAPGGGTRVLAALPLQRVAPDA